MSKDRIQQLLNAVGSMPQADDSSIECTEFNWNEPHCFSAEQLAKLALFTQNLALTLSGKISAFCRTQFEVKIESTSQNYASEFLAEKDGNGKKDYYLLFGSEQDKNSGVLVMPEKTAVGWAKQLLGDTDSSEEQEKELSQLEQSLLCDLATVLVGSLSFTNSKIEACPAEEIISGIFPLRVNESQELFRISFSVKQKESEVVSNASFVIPCSKLEAITGRNKYSQNIVPGQNFSNTILEHINSMPLCITAQLACSRFSFEDMMNLQVDDIIMLDKQISEPVDLIVDNRALGYGQPVVSDGQYAIKITATEFEINKQK